MNVTPTRSQSLQPIKRNSDPWLAATAIAALAAAAGGLFGWILLYKFVEAFEIPFLPEDPCAVTAYAIALLAGATSFAKSLSASRRRQRRHDLGVELGFQLIEKLDPAQEVAILELTGSTSSGHLSNILHRRDESSQLVAADLEITTHSSEGSSRETKKQTIVHLHAPSCSFPEFHLQPEGVLIRLVESQLETGDIDFQTHPEFSKQYFLTGPRESEIRTFFQSELLDFFTGVKGWCVHARGSHLIAYRKGKTYSGLQEQVFLKEAFEILAQLQARAKSIAAKDLPGAESPGGADGFSA